MIVSAEDLSVEFDGALALPPVSFSIAAGEVVGLVGPSGSGKSTLLSSISGIVRPTSGTLTVLGLQMQSAKEADLSTMRRSQLGLVFQDADLLPELNVIENVALTLLFDSMRREVALEKATKALVEVGMEEFAQKSVTTLSGGEQQRVAVARAIVRENMALLIADEPTGSLDQANSELVVELILENSRKRGTAAVIATHDPLVANQCDRIIALRDIGIGAHNSSTQVLR